ncbi:SDR family NAD(P)-dependent oxidoreductase [Novosphingobium bradum]|uniref:SDR family NAD(P)-dependent oxidoreductase n=1 Tax=Novosphingobium bradum TaxID=1737444 RepID=A0ABV7IQM7_9SPHN
MTQDKPLTGKVAIVTGAGAGIGRAIALAYGAAGARVVVASRTPASVAAVVGEITGAGGEALGVTCDVGFADQIQAMVDKAVAAFGAIHILVNNAQAFGTPSEPRLSSRRMPLEATDEEQLEFVFRTGAMASLWAMKAVFPHMKQAGYGRILNFGSSAGYSGAAGTVAYNMTKEAVRALTRTAAREWGQHGITANVLVPFLKTKASTDSLADVAMPEDAMASRLPVRRWGTAERDLAPLAVFLAGEGSGYITGMDFTVEGGHTLKP